MWTPIKQMTVGVHVLIGMTIKGSPLNLPVASIIPMLG